jgi:hypothetical protein
MKKLFLLLLIPAVVPGADDARVAQFYDIARVSTPTGVDPQIGGVAALPDGRLAAVFHQGQLAIYDPKTTTWKMFAEGLHEPLGILPEPDGSLLVMQRPELTRLRDTDRDGVADRYDVLWDGFGMSGNYHEFAFGPVRGPNGKVYVGLNVASNGNTIREEIRGEWSAIGLPREKFYAGEWNRYKEEAGRMYARVKWRGCIVEIDPKTGAASLFATGFRSPDGLGFDAKGNLFVDDNQGDWRGTSEIHVVQRDGFYGHPASLVWRKDWDGADPLKLPVERLNELRTRPAIEIPHNTYANSPTEIVQLPKTAAWGKLGGQLIFGDMNTPRLLRVLPEQVDGVWQGACVILLEHTALKGGLHRMAFIGDTLYVGRLHLTWAGGEGMSSIKPSRAPFETLAMHATPKGFRFEFTEPLAANASEAARWTGKRYYFNYHAAYGSPRMESTDLAPARVAVSADARSVEIDLPELKEGQVYDFNLSGLESSKGEKLLNPQIAYTLNRAPRAR